MVARISDYAQVMNSDTPESSYADCVGFRFSTGAGDTTIKAYVGNSVTNSHDVVDTGVAPDGNFHDFVIYGDASNLYFKIDGTTVATIPLSHSGVPPANQSLDPFVSIEGLSGADAWLFFKYMYHETAVIF